MRDKQNKECVHKSDKILCPCASQVINTDAFKYKKYTPNEKYNKNNIIQWI